MPTLRCSCFAHDPVNPCVRAQFCSILFKNFEILLEKECTLQSFSRLIVIYSVQFNISRQRWRGTFSSVKAPIAPNVSVLVHEGPSLVALLFWCPYHGLNDSAQALGGTKGRAGMEVPCQLRHPPPQHETCAKGITSVS